MLNETNISTGPYSVSILGNTSSAYVFKTRKTEVDRRSAEEMLAELTKHQATLEELKKQIKEIN
ncbi:hypothetical protein MCGE09_00025 [Thaumarchaeota archaeon SCGC AB-539-E09]|nr:hypothetical protein MCGE09_00025 [Thaumarchaeota archaeon SCGC AB-539-E09]